MIAVGRPLLHAGAALLGAAALVAVAAPAEAADLACLSSNRQITCVATGGPAGRTIHWTLNGSPVPAWDNLATIRFGCTPGSVYRVGANMVAPTGETTSLLDAVPCSNRPPV
ncbi:MAG: hypothetical protein V7637_981 [Mycobacteriales bacterium]